MINFVSGVSFTQVSENHKLVTHLIGNPDRLVGLHFDGLHFLVAAKTGNQVMPVFIINQVDIGEIEGLDLIADIADTENTLLAIHTLAPEAKQLAAEMEGELGGIGMEGRLLAADFQ